MNRLLLEEEQQSLQPLKTYRSSEDPYVNNAEGKLCLVAGEVGGMPHSLTFMFLSLDKAGSPLRKKGCSCWGYGFFCSIYLEIKVTDPISGLTFETLESERVP